MLLTCKKLQSKKNCHLSLSFCVTDFMRMKVKKFHFVSKREKAREAYAGQEGPKYLTRILKSSDPDALSHLILSCSLFSFFWLLTCVPLSTLSPCSSRGDVEVHYEKECCQNDMPFFILLPLLLLACTGCRNLLKMKMMMDLA